MLSVAETFELLIEEQRTKLGKENLDNEHHKKAMRAIAFARIIQAQDGTVAKQRAIRVMDKITKMVQNTNEVLGEKEGHHE